MWYYICIGCQVFMCVVLIIQFVAITACASKIIECTVTEENALGAIIAIISIALALSITIPLAMYTFNM